MTDTLTEQQVQSVSIAVANQLLVEYLNAAPAGTLASLKLFSRAGGPGAVVNTLIEISKIPPDAQGREYVVAVNGVVLETSTATLLGLGIAAAVGASAIPGVAGALLTVGIFAVSSAVVTATSWHFKNTIEPELTEFIAEMLSDPDIEFNNFDTLTFEDPETGQVFDVLAATLGNDNLTANSGAAAGEDNISGLSGRDTLAGDAGDNWLDGGLDNDILVASVGNDTLDGGSGTNTLTYATFSQGVDISLLAGSVQLSGAPKDVIDNFTHVTGSGFDDTITGDTLDNSLDGDPGNDSLDGVSGRDILFGDTGDDTLEGGADDDLLLGAKDDDDYEFALSGTGKDVISDADGDIIIDGNLLQGTATLFAKTQPEVMIRI